MLTFILPVCLVLVDNELGIRHIRVQVKYAYVILTKPLKLSVAPFKLNVHYLLYSPHYHGQYSRWCQY